MRKIIKFPIVDNSVLKLLDYKFNKKLKTISFMWYQFWEGGKLIYLIQPDMQDNFDGS